MCVINIHSLGFQCLVETGHPQPKFNSCPLHTVGYEQCSWARIKLIINSKRICPIDKGPTCSVKPGHTKHGSLVGLSNIIFSDHQLDPVPSLWLIQPLVGIHCYLSAEWLSHHQNITNNSIIRPRYNGKYC